MKTNTINEAKLLIILADFSNDLRTLKERDGKFPAQAAVDRLQALAAEAVAAELTKLVADTLSPENFGGRYIHEPVTEFAKQQKQWIEERIALLKQKEEL